VTVVVSQAADVDLEAVRRVAWHGEAVEIAPEALARIRDRRREFESFVEANGDAHLYGITTSHHFGAKTLLSEAARAEYHRHLPNTPPALGPALPDRMTRAIILARLATFVDGHSGVRAGTVAAVAAMLDRPLPYVPERGHGDPGEIILLGHVFRGLERSVDFGVGGAMPLINGSPCAAAALADVVLAAEHRLSVAESVLALAAEAIRAPLAHYDAAFERLWGDPFEAAALRRGRELLEGGCAERRPYQAPVSFRIAPRMLGWLGRLQAQGEECATISLRAMTDNPTFVFPEERPPHGAVLSNGSYHNALAAPMINSFARAWADLAQLAAHQVQRLVEAPEGLLATEADSRLTSLYMTQTGWAEEARQAAQPTLISLGGVGPTEASSPGLLAWRLANEAGGALDVCLATLAIVAGHTIEQAGRRARDIAAAVNPERWATVPDSVAAFVRAHTPLAAETVQELGMGTESVAWRVDGEWVARFPLTADASASLERELTIAPLLASRLDTAVPQFEHVACADDGVPVMSLYRSLDGEPLSIAALARLPPQARARALDELAGLVSALRGVPSEIARDAGASVRPHQGFGHPSQRELHHRHAALIGPEGVARVEALWREYEREGGDPRRDAGVLTHADLKPEHVLHDPVTGRLTAVLDWGDACLSHADFDPAIIGLFFSPEIRDDITARLPGTNRRQVAARARLLVAVRWLTDLDVEVRNGDEEFQAFCVAGLAAHLRRATGAAT
jgi:histidine ammonia-lyase